MHENPNPKVFQIEIPDTPVPPDPLQEMFKRTTKENRWQEKAGELLATNKFDQSFRHKFHTYWTVAGHHIRAQIDNDEALVSLLWAVLPPYVGPGRTLFRGENLDRWVSRKIGLCWSENADIARMFGRGLNATGAGGVLLRLCVSYREIIAGPSDHSQYLGESEYTLDLSKTYAIEAIERYPSSD
jgi:hypothetical protein